MKTKYCKPHSRLMWEINRFKRIQKSKTYESLPKKFKIHCDPYNNCNAKED